MIDAWFVETLAGAAGVATLAAVRRRPVRRSVALNVGALPYAYRRRVRSIVRLARECEARHPSGSLEAFTARETLRAYLPETLAAYLAVPPALRARQRAGGATPDDELRSQLATLRVALERICEADADRAAARMAANGAFLNERFGRPSRPPRASTAELVGDAIEAVSVLLRRALHEGLR